MAALVGLEVAQLAAAGFLQECMEAGEELAEQQKTIESLAHLIIRFSRNGGFANASGF